MNDYLLLRILDVVMWPIAFIIGVGYLGARIRSLEIAYAKIAQDATFDTTRWIGLWTAVLQGTLPATLRAIASDNRKAAAKAAELKVLLDDEGRVARTSETAVIAVLQANGGFPGKPDDKVTRAIVREIREMYSEIDNPTTAPLPAETSRTAVDDLNLDYFDPEDDETEMYSTTTSDDNEDTE